MSQEQPHINPWADKLQQVSLPDADASWNGMQRLLEQHLPVEKKERKRRFFFLLFSLPFLVIGALLVLSYWHFAEKNDSNTHSTGSRLSGVKENQLEINPVIENERSPVNDVTTTEKNTVFVDSAHVLQDVASNKKTEQKANEAEEKHQQLLEGNLATSSYNTSKNEEVNDSESKNTISKHEKEGADKTTASLIAAEAKAEKDASLLTGSSKKKILTKSKKPIKKKVTPRGKSRTTESKVSQNIISPQSNTNAVVSPLIHKNTFANQAEKEVERSLLPAFRSPLDPLNITIAEDSFNNAIVKDHLTRQLPKQETEVNRKGWTFGVGLNHFMTTSAREGAVGNNGTKEFNSEGISRKIGDYIPVPQVRYYFNNKWFVQGEMQFNTPQNAQNVLLDQKSYQQGNAFIRDTVYVKKLSYFNIPLGVYFRPFKNMYVGGGIQFARLSNALALYQSTQRSVSGPPFDSVKVAKVQSIKNDDTLYKRLHTNEFRLFGDVNYQVKCLTLGVRYNYALSNFVKLPVTNSNALTQARNHSLQLYLRYALLDKRKTIKPTSK